MHTYLCYNLEEYVNSKAIKILINEHKLILKCLSLLEIIIARLKEDKSVNISAIKKTIDFLRVFSDKIHHGKEEGYLFPKVEIAAIKENKNAIRKLFQEHDEGKSLIIEMDKSLDNNKIDIDMYILNAKKYIDLLRPHIDYEEQYLFIECDKLLSNEDNEELLNDFKRFDKNISNKTYEEFDKVLDNIEDELKL